jgi:hypothetical protein
VVNIERIDQRLQPLYSCTRIMEATAA